MRIIQTRVKENGRSGLNEIKGVELIQEERRLYLIKELLHEQSEYAEIEIPAGEQEQKNLLRSLFNVRMPKPVTHTFLKMQDAYLKEETKKKGITDLADLMRQQGHEEKTGAAKITPAYNLPCKYILHTVGPIIRGGLTKKDKEQLASCYRSCLKLAERNNVQSITFCCISTGEFHFPNDKAAEIAVRTVKEYKAQTNSQMEVVFNVFKKIDDNIYRELLGANKKAEK